MVKGVRRQVVVVREPQSPYIEEAYFVLREETAETAPADLLAEAKRIITQGGKVDLLAEKTAASHPVKWFAAGAVTMFCCVLLILFAL